MNRINYRSIPVKFLLLSIVFLTGGWLLTASHPVKAGEETAVLSTAGQLYREWWSNIDGKTVNLLTNHPDFPENPSDFDFITTFETPLNWGENYGTRVRGILYPPKDGNYIFWIASDDNGELWLSDDHNPGNASRIATVPEHTDPRQWDKYPAQKSIPIQLRAGKAYYIEAVMKEATEDDNLAVAWQIPGEARAVIDGVYLSPFTHKAKNIGLDGTAKQSSTRMVGFNYEASNAIDGNVDGINANNSITHTNEENQPWWEVDLGSVYYLDAVRLWNRTDCCGERLSDFYLLVSEDPFRSEVLNSVLNQPGVQSYFFSGQAAKQENIFTRATGQFVRVQLTGSNYLSLAEVQLWGTAVQQTSCGDLFQEGENGTYSGNFEAGSDAAASNGFYTHVPEDSDTEFFGSLSDNFMSYCVNIQAPGLYQINTRTLGPDGGSDSFYVTVDGLPADGLRWNIDPSGEYEVAYIEEHNANEPYQLSLDQGQHTLNIYQREDGARLDWFEFELINGRPLLSNPGDQNSIVGDSISLQIEAEDPDDDDFSYEADGLPTGLSINDDGLISGTISAEGTFDVTVTVDDGISGPSSLTFIWTVEPANNPPVVTNPGDQTNTVGDTISLQIEADDADNENLRFEADNLPDGLEINEDSGLITGQPTTVQTRSVTVTVNDGNGGEDSVTFTWTISEEPNTPPQITNPGNQSDEEGDDVLLNIDADDADGDPLTFSATGLPPELDIDDGNGRISGTLTQAGSYQVTVTVSDGNATDSAEFTWQVEEPDEPVVEDVSLYLPAMMNFYQVDEPNDSCDEAVSISMNVNHDFYYEDQYDWYSFDLSSTQTVQIRLTNFNAPGQIIVYSGTCGNLTFLQNNGNFSSTKVINLTNLGAGRYYIRIITDSGYNTQNPYGLIIDGS